ncbi:MAG: methyltransferase [Erysipelotrichaceae bacterium]
MDHYFSDNRHLETNRKEISFRFWCFTLKFLSDNGVFSKTAIDYGSRVLLGVISDQKLLGKKALDMGCGYGVIGITLKKCFPETEFTLCDVNPRALDLAKDNAKINEVDVEVKLSHVYENILGNTFSDIISNPPIRAGKVIVHEILSGSYEHLACGGRLWVVIRKAQGAPSAIAKIKEVYGNCEIMKKDKGYYVLMAEKKD